MNRKTFGELVAQARARLGLSQKELAARLHKADGTAISAQYLNDIERDRRAAPSDELLEQLARLLRISPDVLYHYAGRLPPDVAGLAAEPEQIAAAYAALRKTLRSEKSRKDQ